MPKATKENLMLDKTKSRGGWPEGPDVTFNGEHAVDHLYQYLKDMKLVEIRKLVRNTLLKESSHNLYFAYGSNTSKKEMENHGVNCADLGQATLPGFKLRYAGYGINSDTGRADIYQDSESEITGRLYSVSDFKNLDKKEGTKNPGLYKRKKVTVYHEGIPISASTYMMDDMVGDNPPSDEYLHKVANGRKSLSECVIASGELNGNHVMVKNRDRNYNPDVSIIRELTDDGLELVYMADLITGYIEGMNSNGIGVINSSLMVLADETEVSTTAANNGIKKKSGEGSAIPTGKKIKSSILAPDIKSALKQASMSDFKDPTDPKPSLSPGIKGHTFIGCPTAMYSLELTGNGKGNETPSPTIRKLETDLGWVVRTNHGIDLAYAGYDPVSRADDYISSRIRKAQAEVELASCTSFDDLAPAIAKKRFENNSNFNMLRDTDNLYTTSQIALDLNDLVFHFYILDDYCNFKGIIDKTPADYIPKIDIKIFKWAKKS